jgi:hypothetical protein
MKIRAGGEPYKNATATLMKIATGRSPTERCDIGRGFVNGPSIKGLRETAARAAVHITC